MPVLPTDANDSPNYTPAQHATHHNVLAGINNELGNFVQSTSAPGSPVDGDLWLDTDEAAPSGTSAPTVLAEQTLSSTATYFEFTGISQAYRHLVLEGRLRSDRAATETDILFLRCGSSGTLDTGSNYAFLITSGVTNDTSSSGQTAIQIGRCAAATAGASTFSDFSCTIHDYKTTTWWRSMRASTMTMAAANALTESLGHWQNTSAAINIIRVYPANGPNFIAGSQLRLIGIPAP